MRFAYPVAAVRSLEDATIAVTGADVLMQRAAVSVVAAVAAEARSLRGGLYGARVLVCVGPGNNGGDALFAGALLARRGAAVTAVRCLGQPHAAGLAALRAAGGRLVDLSDLDLGAAGDPARPGADLVVDGVLGIGGRPGLPADVARLAEAVAAWTIPTVAVDLPSGVAADEGAVPGASFWATRTVTFGVAKPCHLLEPARSRCGRLEVADIGLGDDVAERTDWWLAELDEQALARRWPFPGETSDKYARGVVGLDTGSAQYPGAGVLSTVGAVSGGAGMVRFVGAEQVADLVRQRLPNVVFSPGRVQAHVFGCGWGDRSDGHEVLLRAAEEGLPVVVDADGLRYLPSPTPASWLLTPHAGELARLLERDRSWVSEDPVRAVREAVRRTGATVLLKGASQLVAAPDGPEIAVALPGPGWTAQAGSGDVLAGLCGAVLAAGRSAYEAAVLAASLQALTARRHPGSLPPHDMAALAAGELGRLQGERDRALARQWGRGEE